jgi:hypothetical protein
MDQARSEHDDRLQVELTTGDALIVLAAVRQFEPYWSAGLSEPGRIALLADTREAVERIIRTLSEAAGESAG